MANTPKDQPLYPVGIHADIAEFIIDRQSRNLSPRTIIWYQESFSKLTSFLDTESITDTTAITPVVLRHFLLHLQHGHNPGGVLRIYGAVRTFLRWYAVELAPKDWESPTERVKPPKRPDEILEPLSTAHFNAMLSACEPRTFIGDRDRAVLLMLLDSGLRHNEITALRCGHVDIDTGQVTVKKGKGGKDRVTFVGHMTRRALVAYLRHRKDAKPGSPLWVTKWGDELSRAGVRQAVRRSAQKAGVPEAGMHAFRRAFAVNYLKAGGSIATLQRLLGHSNISVTLRYLKLDVEDLRAAYQSASPVDNLLSK